MSDSPATRPSQITVEAVREIVSGFLLEAGKASGLSPQRFRYDLCERYGISDDTAKNWICGADHPEDHNLLNLFADYPELANRALTTFGIADRVERAGGAPESIEAAVQRAHGLLLDQGVEEATGKSAALVREWGDPDNDGNHISVEQAVNLDVASSLQGGGAPLLEAHRRRVEEAERAGVAPEDRDVLTPRLTGANNGAADEGDELSCSPTPLADGYAFELRRSPSVNGALVPPNKLPAVIDELERALALTTKEHARTIATLIIHSFAKGAPDDTTE